MSSHGSPYGKPKENFKLDDHVITRFTVNQEGGEIVPIHLSEGLNKCYEHLYPGRYSYTGAQYEWDSLDNLPTTFDEAKEMLIEMAEKEVEKLKVEIKVAREKLKKVKKLSGPTKFGKPIDLSEANY